MDKTTQSKLTSKQRRFVEEYLIDLNATQAAIRAGYSEKTARSVGSENLTKPDIQAAIAAAQQDLSERTEITQDEVVKRWLSIATADVNELVQYRRENCRYCWGVGHAYQWTEAEFEKAQQDAASKKRDEPVATGGFGFLKTREPNPDCPECGGQGHGHIHVTDTRRLKGGARLLYAGVKSGKDGLEVKMHDQMKALENVARHLGMLKQQHELTGKNGAPISVKSEASQLLGALNDEQLAQLEAIAATLAGSGSNSGGAGAQKA